MAESSLRALLGERESERHMTVEERLNDPGPLRSTSLGNALDAMMQAYSEMIGLAHQTLPVQTPPTPDHVKEAMEVHVKQWRDSVLDMQTELTRVGMRWELSHPEERHREELEDVEKAITRQHTLMEKARETMDKRTDEFFANPKD